MNDIRIGYPITDLNPTGEPIPKQLEFHNLGKKYNLFASGFGTGKTLALALSAIEECVTYENNYGIIARKDLQELKSTTLKDFFDVCPEGIVRQHDKLNKVITFVNNSQIYYMNLDYAREAERKIKSLNLGFVVIDQLEEIDENIFMALQGRLRRLNSSRTLYAGCNPAGHDWVWSRWKQLPFDKYIMQLQITPAEAEDICQFITKRMNATAYTALGKATQAEKNQYLYGEFEYPIKIIQVMYEKWNYGIVEATSLDNPYLPPDYIDALLKYPESWVNRYVYCSWDDFKGVVYSEFSEQIHTIDHALISQNIDDYNHYIALDYGYRNPTGIVFAYTDYDGKIYIYEEFYQSGLLVSEICNVIKQNPHWMKSTMLIDPSTKRTESTGKSILDEFYDNGVYFQPADNDVLQGILKVNEMFKNNKIAISKNCYNLISEIGKYKWKELKPSINSQNLAEAPMKKDDHLMDALRYLVNSTYSSSKRGIIQPVTPIQQLISRNYLSKAPNGSKKPVSAISTF